MSDEYRDQMRAKFDKLNSSQKIEEFAKLRQDKEEAEERLKEINKRYDFLRTVLIPEWMDGEGLSSLKSSDNTYRLVLQGDAHVSCTKEHFPELKLWLTDRDLGNLITEHVNPSTLKAMVKDRMRSGNELPECVKVTPYTKAVLQKV